MYPASPQAVAAYVNRAVAAAITGIAGLAAARIAVVAVVIVLLDRGILRVLHRIVLQRFFDLHEMSPFI